MRVKYSDGSAWLSIDDMQAFLEGANPAFTPTEGLPDAVYYADRGEGLGSSKTRCRVYIDSPQHRAGIAHFFERGAGPHVLYRATIEGWRQVALPKGV